MKSIAFAAAAAAALLAAPALAQIPGTQDAPQWSLAIHGGAGVIERAQLSPERDAAYRAGLQAALDAGAMGASISGAGPSVFAWFETRLAAEAAAADVQAAFAAAGFGSQAWVTPLNSPGAALL